MAAQFGRRLRKGAATTAVAAVAVAALSASQAPGVNDHGRQTAADAAPSPDASASDGSATGNSPYYTDLPPLNSPSPSPSTGPGPTPSGTTEAGIPATVLDAYKKAEAALRDSKPGCNLPWQLLAAIGRVESGQARGGRVTADGTTVSPILGPQLDGNGFALIKDTDNGAYDGNSSYDQAVGPMQFIPSTWAWAGRDGNGDGKKDPNNVYDAALAAGHYLCRNNWDLSDQNDLDRAILSYNNSREYLNLVMRWLEYYRKGTHEVPDGTGTLPDNRSDEAAGARPSPSAPGTPGTGGSKPEPSPRPDKPGRPGGGTTTPKPPTTPPGSPSAPPSTPPTPTDTVHHLEDAGTAKLTAMAGDAFTKRISTRAETKAGKAVAKVRIRFTIVGDTDTTFTNGESVATVSTNSSGVAVAPALQAGEKTGDVTVRATVVGRTIAGLDYTATVTERAADTLARTGDAPLTCTPGGEFANQVEVKATYRGAVADGVAATATLIKSADDPTANDKGPYFKDADGKPVRVLTGLRTDPKGLLKLPKLYADDTTGTFLLRVNTEGGATLTVELTVAAAGTSSPSPSASPSA
ncbi:MULTISPECIES: lytic transglycosylase domain-containing protein [Streptomyces]|uniref:Lytic murein transglycosylase n=1 Tax=Streptomyces chartreusis NRRL 3882 TaxID=1079985 RepID=A0A2N9BGR8_STRCX|nr:MULTISPECIES: lytic transglycosylase domain-containing protein [Streptomyces]MYS88195.1 transglycosylase SLT domain-containing protein [Streptomyces sp. SID5464]SOR82566.1 lytic murein transglycosylase [Streptomyces chartreusis NRRL 3882]